MPERPLQPSDLYAPLTWDRLIILAKLLWDVRLWVANDAKPERGDRACGIGLRCWEQGTYAVTLAAKDLYSDWLSMEDKSAHFVFKIASMPIRFCRGDTDDLLPENYSYPTHVERAEIELALGKSYDGFFRIVVEADGKGFPKGVHLALAREGGQVTMSWQIPIDDRGTDTGTVALVTPRLPITLPPLIVRSVAEVEAEKVAQVEAEAETAREARKRRMRNEKGA